MDITHDCRYVLYFFCTIPFTHYSTRCLPGIRLPSSTTTFQVARSITSNTRLPLPAQSRSLRVTPSTTFTMKHCPAFDPPPHLHGRRRHRARMGVLRTERNTDSSSIHPPTSPHPVLLRPEPTVERGTNTCVSRSRSMMSQYQFPAAFPWASVTFPFLFAITPGPSRSSGPIPRSMVSALLIRVCPFLHFCLCGLVDRGKKIDPPISS